MQNETVWIEQHQMPGFYCIFCLEKPFLVRLCKIVIFFSLVEIAGCLLFYENVSNKITATFRKPWMHSAFVFRLFWCQPWLRFPQWLHTWTTVPKRTSFSWHRQWLLDRHGDGWGAGISFWSSEVSEEMKRKRNEWKKTNKPKVYMILLRAFRLFVLFLFSSKPHNFNSSNYSVSRAPPAGDHSSSSGTRTASGRRTTWSLTEPHPDTCMTPDSQSAHTQILMKGLLLTLNV